MAKVMKELLIAKKIWEHKARLELLDRLMETQSALELINAIEKEMLALMKPHEMDAHEHTLKSLLEAE